MCTRLGGEYRSATSFEESTRGAKMFSVTLIWSLLERDRMRKRRKKNLISGKRILASLKEKKRKDDGISL